MGLSFMKYSKWCSRSMRRTLDGRPAKRRASLSTPTELIVGSLLSPTLLPTALITLLKEIHSTRAHTHLPPRCTPNRRAQIRWRHRSPRTYSRTLLLFDKNLAPPAMPDHPVLHVAIRPPESIHRVPRSDLACQITPAPRTLCWKCPLMLAHKGGENHLLSSEQVARAAIFPGRLPISAFKGRIEAADRAKARGQRDF